MSDDLLARRRRHLAPSLSLSYREPLTIVRGAGATLYDPEGRAYLDCVNNVCHVGHCHPDVVAAGQRQMATLNTNTRYLHPLRLEYAERLTATFADPLSVVTLVNSGSEANDLALRIARTVTGRRDVVVLDHAYHGHTRALIDVSPYKFARAGGQGPPPATHVVALPPGPPTMPDVVPAALIAESIPGCAGQVVLPDGWLATLAAQVQRAGGLVIADEVQVGLGRTGQTMWAYEAHGVTPDIVTLGKPLGNGHPLAAVVTTPAIAGAFANGMEYFNTFGGNPVSCAIGLAVLDVMEREGLQAHALAVGERLTGALRGLDHASIVEVRGRGLFIGVQLSSAAVADDVVDRLRQRGVLISADGPEVDVLKIKPPLVFSAADADRLVETLDRALAD